MGWRRAAFAVWLPTILLAQAPQVQPVLTGSGFIQPTHIAGAGDGSGRVYVVEQAGRIRILTPGVGVAEPPFLDIRDRVGCCGERGLLSVAFPPGYAQKRHFYVDYTDTNGDVTISRYNLAGSGRADPASEFVILKIPHHEFPNHNGGQLAFGPDGYLYIGVGDGGSEGDPHGNGQNTMVLLGKLLRIDVEGLQSPYGIPSDNPFASGTAGAREIWAYGLRNPWRFSFDRANGDIWIGDVGQDSWEEIDFQPHSSRGGENYGWNRTEGMHCFQPGCSFAGITMPVQEYSHTEGNCSVTGGFVYRGAAAPAFQGTYIYGDYCTGRIWAITGAGAARQNTLLLNPGFNISTFGEDDAGELWVANYSAGQVYMLVPVVTAVVDSASYQPVIAAGGLASIFGTALGISPGLVTAPGFPLPKTLNGIGVTVNGVAAPLLAVANINGIQQINLQVPWETAPGSAIVQVLGINGAALTIQATVAAVAPALFTADPGYAIAANLTGQLVNVCGPPGIGRPCFAARPGDTLVLWGTGFGAVANQPPDGAATPDLPLSPAAPTTVTIGGQPAQVLFSGLAPRFAGLYQLNVVVPGNLGGGDQDIVVTIAGQSSKPVKLRVAGP